MLGKLSKRLILLFLEIFLLTFISLFCFPKEDYCKGGLLKNYKKILLNCYKIKSGVGSCDWVKLLISYEIHDDNSKKYIFDFSKKEEDIIEVLLAKVLIEEWDISRNSEKLKIPFVIKKKPFKFNNIKLYLSPIIFVIEIDCLGNIKISKIISQNKNLKQIGIDPKSIKDHIIFRPAFANGKFTCFNNYVLTVFID